MENGISVSVSIITPESDYMIRLDGAQPAYSKYVRSMQIVEFAAAPGSHVLTVEEKRAYMSRLWWLPKAVRAVIQSLGHERALVDEKGTEPQYLCYSGVFSTDKTVQLEFVQEGSKLALLHGDIQESCNEARFDARWRGRLMQYLLLPALALAVPLTALSAAMHIYAATVGKTLLSVIFAVIGTFAAGFVVLRTAKIKKEVRQLMSRYCGKRQSGRATTL